MYGASVPRKRERRPVSPQSPGESEICTCTIQYNGRISQSSTAPKENVWRRGRAARSTDYSPKCSKLANNIVSIDVVV